MVRWRSISPLPLCTCAVIFTRSGWLSSAECLEESPNDGVVLLSSSVYILQRALAGKHDTPSLETLHSFLAGEKLSLRDREVTDVATKVDTASSRMTDDVNTMRDDFNGNDAKRQIDNVWYVTPSLLDPTKKNRSHPPVRWDLAPKGPVIAVPVVDEPDQLRSLIFSIDMPIAKLAIVWNRFPDNATWTIHQKIRDVLAEAKGALGEQFLHTYESPGNLGFGGSFNHMWRDPKLAHFKWWVNVNADISFGTGALAALTEHFTSPLAANKLITMVLPAGFSFFATSNRFFKEVGYFDENIYPALDEDCDMMVRVKLLHGNDGRVYEGLSGIPYHHGGSVSRSVASSYGAPQRFNIAWHNSNEYYSVKWNVITPLDASSCGEIVPGSFTCPFNNPQYCHTRMEVPLRSDFIAIQKKIFDPAVDLASVGIGDDLRAKWQIRGVTVHTSPLQVAT